MTRTCSLEMTTIKTALDDFIDILGHDEISNAAKTTTRGFTQPRKITLLDVLLFYTLRFAETTNKDISAFFSKLDKPKVSKQAMFKALNKTNPNVFPLIIRQMAEKFYSHMDYDTLDGYIVLACDGSKMDLPPTDELKERFGGYLNKTIKTYDQVKKPMANCSVLIDILNHVILDAAIEPCMTSELPMLFQHLENCEEMLRGKKVILLCDRYYGSAELFLYCMLHGYNFIVRNKSYTYKHHVAKVEHDGMINVPFDKAWYRRMKRDDCRNYAKQQESMLLRVVKNRYEYTLDGKKRKQEPTVIDAVYLTNLDSSTYSTADILQLYHIQRWDNETAYFDIKNHLESERFNSGKYNIVVNELYGKILCYTLCGRFYDAADKQNIAKYSEEGQTTRYDYIPNMKNIADTIRVEYKILQYFSGKMTPAYVADYLNELVLDFSKRTVPVRPGRHYKRWGRWMPSIPTYKFRVDGRRNPPIDKCYKTNGYMTKQ